MLHRHCLSPYLIRRPCPERYPEGHTFEVQDKVRLSCCARPEPSGKVALLSFKVSASRWHAASATFVPPADRIRMPVTPCIREPPVGRAFSSGCKMQPSCVTNGGISRPGGILLQPLVAGVSHRAARATLSLIVTAVRFATLDQSSHPCDQTAELLAQFFGVGDFEGLILIADQAV